MKHLHSRDPRKRLAVEALRLAAGLSRFHGKVTCIEYDPATGHVEGTVMRSYSTEEKRQRGLRRDQKGYLQLGRFKSEVPELRTVETLEERAWSQAMRETRERDVTMNAGRGRSRRVPRAETLEEHDERDR